MIKALLDLNVASVLRRIEQGDCPTEPALSVETLENMVHDLSRALAATPTPPTLSEDLREAAQAVLLYADPSGDGLYDGANDIVGVKQSGEMVLKGSFITICVRLRAALAQVKAS